MVSDPVSTSDILLSISFAHEILHFYMYLYTSVICVASYISCRAQNTTVLCLAFFLFC